MTEQDRAMSPYLSLRQAVRPAIVAHGVLAGEQERTGRLAAECEDLLALTRELLKAAGQARILGAPEPGGGRDAPLLDAYAEAGMLWAKVVGSSMALAGTLLERGDWDEVRRLARCLGEAGEDDAAASLAARLGQAVWRAYYEPLRKISSTMQPPEIRDAINALRAVLAEAPEEFPDRNREVNRLLPPLAASIYALMKEKNIALPYNSRVEHIAAGGVARYPEIVTMSLDELSAEFEGTCG